MYNHLNFSFCRRISICKSCNFVEINENFLNEKYKCSNCKSLTDTNRYLASGVLNLAIVIDELNNFEKSDIIIAYRKPEHIKAVTSLSLIVFFCSLEEVLLENFLKECMNKKKLDDGIQSFILDRNTRISDRINILFLLFTGEKWKNVLRILQTNSSFDYLEMANFCRKVKKIRNDMLHDAKIIDIEDKIPNECYNNTKALVSLFVDLHNRFIAK